MSPEVLTPLPSSPEPSLANVEQIPLTQKLAAKLNSVAQSTTQALEDLGRKMSDAPNSPEEALRDTSTLLRLVVQPIGALSVVMMPVPHFDSRPAIVIEIPDESSILSTEPGQLFGPTRTPTPTKTPRPLVPTFTPTPSPEATAMPKQIELPLQGSDILKPSEKAKAKKLTSAPNFRTGPSTNTEAVPQIAGTTVFTTGHSINQPDGIWHEVVADNEVLFVRGDVFRADAHTPTSQERIKLAFFADTPPLNPNQITVNHLTKGMDSLGGTTDESDLAKSLINKFWGTDVESKTTTNPYNALQKRVAIAANGEGPGFFETAGMESYAYTDKNGNKAVMATNINGGFMKITTTQNAEGILQAESISLQHWNQLVEEFGLKQAQEIARRIGGVSLRIFETTINDQQVISSPDGPQAVSFYLSLTNDKRFDDGVPEPVATPTSTPIPTATPPRVPTPTPVPPTPTPPKLTPTPAQPAMGEGEDEVKIKYSESEYTTPDGITRSGHTVDIGNLQITTDNEFIQQAFETTANDIYGDRQPDKTKNTFIDLNLSKQGATNRAMGLTDLVRSHLNKYHINTGAPYEDIVQAFMRGEIPLHIVLLPPSGMTIEGVLEDSTTRGGSEAPYELPFLELNSGYFGVGLNRNAYTIFFSSLLTGTGRLAGRGDEADVLSDAFGAAAEISKFGDRFSIGADKTDYSDKFIELFYYDIDSNPDSPFSFSPLQK